MKYSIVVAFGAAALAQNVTQVPTQSCVGVVTETVYTTFYSSFCTPCDSTSTSTSLASNSNSASISSLTSTASASTTANVGSNSDNGPILASTTSATATVDASTSASVSDGSSTTASTQPDQSTSSVASATTSIASPPPPSSATTVVTSSTTAATTTSNIPVPAPTVPPAGTRQQIALSSLPADYIQRALFAHNLHRANASIPLLTWSPSLAATAQKIGETCIYEHNTAIDGGGYGQNIGAGFLVNQVPAMITNNMYNNEINYYPGPYGADNVDLSNFGRWGHYSQLVWRSTAQVGCATVFCPNGLANTSPGTPPYFTVCNYSPAGNFVGSWSQVATPLGGGTVEFTAN